MEWGGCILVYLKKKRGKNTKLPNLLIITALKTAIGKHPVKGMSMEQN